MIQIILFNIISKNMMKIILKIYTNKYTMKLFCDIYPISCRKPPFVFDYEVFCYYLNINSKLKINRRNYK